MFVKYLLGIGKKWQDMLKNLFGNITKNNRSEKRVIVYCEYPLLKIKFLN